MTKVDASNNEFNPLVIQSYLSEVSTRLSEYLANQVKKFQFNSKRDKMFEYFSTVTNEIDTKIEIYNIKENDLILYGQLLGYQSIANSIREQLGVSIIRDEIGFFGKHFLNTIKEKNAISIKEISDVYSISDTLTRKLIKQYQQDFPLVIVEKNELRLTDFARKVLEEYRNEERFVFRGRSGKKIASKLFALELEEDDDISKDKYKRLCLVETEVIQKGHVYSIPLSIIYPHGNARESSRSSEILGDKKEVAKNINAFYIKECEHSFGRSNSTRNEVLMETIYNKIKVSADIL